MLPGAAQRLSRWIHLVSDLRQDYFHPGAVDPNLDMFQLAVAGSVSRDEAEQNAREVKKLIGENALVTFDTESKSWGCWLHDDFRARKEKNCAHVWRIQGSM